MGFTRFRIRILGGFQGVSQISTFRVPSFASKKRRLSHFPSGLNKGNKISAKCTGRCGSTNFDGSELKSQNFGRALNQQKMVGLLPGFCWHNPVNNLFLCLEGGVVYPGQYLAELKGMQNMLRYNNAIYLENITTCVHPTVFQNLSPNCVHLANFIFRVSSCNGFLWCPVKRVSYPPANS